MDTVELHYRPTEGFEVTAPYDLAGNVTHISPDVVRALQLATDWSKAYARPVVTDAVVTQKLADAIWRLQNGLVGA